MNMSNSRTAKVFVLFTAAILILANAAPANAATKTITCYKGTIVKKVTATNPKCPTGYKQK